MVTESRVQNHWLEVCAAALACAALGRCYEITYSKPGTTPEATRVDLDECTRNASQAAQVESQGAVAEVAVGGGDPLTAQARRQSEYNRIHRDRTTSCMRSLGYRDELRPSKETHL